MGVHDGHRQRLISRFLEESIDGFDEHNILELLLFFSVPRQNTNEIAHRLLDRFGTFSGVLDAPFSELKEVKGIGDNSAALIKLIPELSRRYNTDRNADICLNSSQKAGEYIAPRFIGRMEETVFMVCIDSKCRVLSTELIHRGSINSAEINIRKVVASALKNNAVGVILAHNHPGGVALPSGEDLATTERVRAALETVSIRLIDHIIVADSDFVSLADSGSTAVSHR